MLNQNHAKPFIILAVFMPKCVTSLRGAHLRVIALRQHSYLRRCWSGGETFATLCKI